MMTDYKRRLLWSLFAFLSAIQVAAAQEHAEVWPQWRGPHRDCVVAGPAWPDSLAGEHLSQSWRVELGPSYSGPIVTADRVFVTETKDKKSEVVRALDRNTGQELWRTEWEGAMSVPFFAASNGSWIRATPAVDGDKLYVAGMRDLLVCLRTEDGKILWQVDFMEKFGTPLPAFGFVSSPLIHGPHLFVQAGGGVVKLDKQTGEILWRTLQDDGGMFGSAFSSPTIATITGREQLVAQTRKTLAGVDLESGEVLWSQDIPAFRGMNIVTPTVFNNQIFTSSYGGASLMFGLDDQGAAQQLWRNKLQGYMSTPVVIDGHAYIHLRSKRFACIDLASGQEKWVTKPYGGYWSMVVQGQTILALDERGDLLLIQANPQKFELLDSRHISDEPTWAHLAVCGSEIFVRSLNAQIVYQWK